MPLPAYLVQDSDQLAAGKKLVSAFSDGYVDELATGEVLMGNTLEELAEAIRQSEGGKDAPDFSTERFVATVNAYNKRYDAGEDADYGRPFSTMVPVKKDRPLLCHQDRPDLLQHPGRSPQEQVRPGHQH